MTPVSFVRTSPRTLGEEPEEGAVRCTSCGNETAGTPGEGYGYTNPLSLDACFVQHPSATYFVRVGNTDATAVGENKYLGVRRGDVLTIDRSVEPTLGKLVLAVCDGEFVLCRFTEHGGERFLVCGRERREAVRVSPDGASVWGVVVALARGM